VEKPHTHQEGCSMGTKKRFGVRRSPAPRRVSQRVNRALQDGGGRQYYDPPREEISIGWGWGPPPGTVCKGGLWTQQETLGSDKRPVTAGSTRIRPGRPRVKAVGGCQEKKKEKSSQHEEEISKRNETAFNQGSRLGPSPKGAPALWEKKSHPRTQGKNHPQSIPETPPIPRG